MSVAVSDKTLKRLCRYAAELSSDDVGCVLLDTADIIAAVLDYGDSHGEVNTYGEEISVDDLRPDDVQDILNSYDRRVPAF